MPNKSGTGQITIIGIGLIGSSIARAVRDKNLPFRIVACDNDELSLAFAKKGGFVDEVSTDALTAVAGSHLVIIATPPAVLENIAQRISSGLSDGAIVMDVASVKQPAIAAISKYLPSHVTFIPTHPIAGSADSGVRTGKTNMFEKKRVIITPAEPPAPELMNELKKFWGAIGAKVEAMPPDIHDMLYAYMSHLPQLIAFCVRKPLKDFLHAQEALQNPVYKTFLRITNSPLKLWNEIFSANKANILMALDRYIDVTTHVAGELKSAPAEEKTGNDLLLSYSVLFPRIVASCLVTTVMEAEKNCGFNFARYAGTGFADFTAPALVAPDADIEQISKQYGIVANIIDDFLAELKKARSSIADGEYVS